MARGIKKFIYYGILSIVVVTTLVAIAAGVKYYFIIKAKPLITPPKTATLSKPKIQLGSPVAVNAIITTTWKSRPVEASIISGKGSQAIGKPDISLCGIGWGTYKWRVTGLIQPFQTGKIATSQMTVSFDSTGIKRQDKQAISIPAFEAIPLTIKNHNKLDLATKLKPLPNNLLKILLIVSGSLIGLVLVIIILLWWFRRDPEQKTIIPPWTIALSQLHELSNSLKNGLISGEACITKLSDIVRFYLEKQIHTHAQTQTTKEFLYDLERPGSPLPENHRSFLKEFMTAADLVKFANCPADNSLLENAIAKADTLVQETKPQATKEGEK